MCTTLLFASTFTEDTLTLRREEPKALWIDGWMDWRRWMDGWMNEWSRGLLGSWRGPHNRLDPLDQQRVSLARSCVRSPGRPQQAPCIAPNPVVVDDTIELSTHYWRSAWYQESWWDVPFCVWEAYTNIVCCSRLGKNGWWGERGKTQANLKSLTRQPTIGLKSPIEISLLMDWLNFTWKVFRWVGILGFWLDFQMLRSTGL